MTKKSRVMISDEEQEITTSFYHRAPSPCVDVTSFEHDLTYNPINCRKTLKNKEILKKDTLLVTKDYNFFKNDGELSDRYYTASSGDDLFDEDNRDDALCLDLTMDGNNPGMIDIQTLSAYSSMFAHYNPIIQSDERGNPVFVAPPPPSDENTSNTTDKIPSATILEQEVSFTNEFKNPSFVIDNNLMNKQQPGVFSDAITELTDVMEKMANFINDPSKLDD